MTLPGTDEPLPDDPLTLQAMVRELLDALAAARRSAEALRTRLDQLLRRLYGPKSEKVSSTPSLFDNESRDTAAAPAPPERAPDTPPTRKKGRHGRRRVPRDLPRQRIEYDLTDVEKLCPWCHGSRARIGEEVSERLDYRPARLCVVEHVRPKYACRRCHAHVAVAPRPREALPKSVAAPGLLAQVITAKFADHLPLHRLEGILARHGMKLSRSTMCDWLAGCAKALGPIYDEMCMRVRDSKVIHTDDTPVPVLDRERERTRTGRIWVYLGDAQNPYTVYDATPSRSRDGPQSFLSKYQGYVQADAFGGYDGLFATGATEVACWAHARRKFVEAEPSDSRRSREALAHICRLYDVERRAKGLGSGNRLSLRQREAVPVLRAIQEWLDATRASVLPKSPLGAAITYATNQWTALNVYVTDGVLAIDNNAAERALRGVAVGRKNWLFWGSDRGGKTAAVLTSLVATCRRHGIDPWSYLADVLTHLPSHPTDRVGALLPDAWAQAQRATS
ncbi:IS66 family element, transposase OS=Rhodopirellula europaea 6C GN=RE6C_02664 PE=4 SV=1: LZ_Tnp_IS66: zf-IS66: DDE_Tnp_IS66: DDE_Tnp_IS66_C [Gemmata massiliana]|uniref:Transposase IS66 central domain-containing protein n=1 Tax=Gemmata massiliana TaxID=1210884 RepID=A0A6P2CU42_9BACT|nr:IS66 family transposase [Gemmata massiliana]VTR91665.1 IS66 family element, transposase OS=Rhodopirellula europaea 6C GN=RE6C_02664 PE=4 SV=1: LZ_Tnp_IS66: zf-IS66: DDE_Tnp_IS66: DDE_Tnp_IS66_C [Gemmata massiliana]